MVEEREKGGCLLRDFGLLVLKVTTQFATSDTRRELGLVKLCKDFWDCY